MESPFIARLYFSYIDLHFLRESQLVLLLKQFLIEGNILGINRNSTSKKSYFNFSENLGLGTNRVP